MTPETYAYLQTFGCHEPSVLKSLREHTENLPGSHMRIAPEVGQLLAFLIQAIGAKAVLELGTFHGYSTLWMALALPIDGYLTTCDIDASAVKVVQPFWEESGVADKVDFKLGPALDTLKDLQKRNTRFDFIFIDANKSDYLDYYELGLSLLNPLGIIAIDNTLGYHGAYLPNTQAPSAQAIDKLNKYIHEDPRVTMSMLPIGDGVTLVRKKS